MSSHFRRWRGIAVSVALVGALTTAMTGTASGATPFSKPVVALPTTCHNAMVTWTAGVARGFAQCARSTHVYYVQGTGARAFVRRNLGPLGGQMLDVTDDGIATYLLYAGNRGIGLVIRYRTGTVTDRILEALPTGDGNQGAIAAIGGKWWAVWTHPGSRGAWQAHTMGTVTGAQRILAQAPGVLNYPDLTVVSSTGVGLVYSQGHTHGCDTVEWARSTSANGWTRSSNLHTCGLHPTVSHASGEWRIAWLNGPNAMLAERQSGGWVKRRLSSSDTGSPGGTISLAVLGSTVAVAWTTKDAEGRSRGVVDVRRSGHWTRSVLTSHIRGDVVHESAATVGLSRGGHTQLLLTDNDGPDRYYVVRRG
jgi:hypothetical protein